MPVWHDSLLVMDGRSRIATIRVGTDMEDPTPATKFNLEDHLGTSSVMLDFNGDLINREEYYPFGETCFGAFAKKRYRYVGKEKDSESGLYYYGARYYAPWMCRFVSVDPLAAQYAQLTPYNYAANDPTGDLDIDGCQNRTTQPSASANEKSTAPPIESIVLPPVSTNVVLQANTTPLPPYSESKPMTAREAAGGFAGAQILIGMAMKTHGHYTSEQDFFGQLNGDFHAFDSLESMGGKTTEDPNYGKVWYPTGNFHDTSKMTHPEGIFYMSDDIPASEFFYMMVGSWKSGLGYENYYFGPNSNASQQLLNSDLGSQALAKWRQLNMGKTPGEYQGFTSFIGNEPSLANLKNEWVDNYRELGTPLTVSHTIGSAMWSVEVGADELILRAFNVMNVGSAIGANAQDIMGIPFWDGKDMGVDRGYPKPQSTGQYPYTNISQTLEMRIPISRVLGR